jgi:hypothetical protein
MKAVMIGTLAGILAVPPPKTEAWIFFSPESPDAARLMRRARDLGARPVLLSERYLGRRTPSRAFTSTAAAARDLRVWDEEGFALAERLGIRELPALAVRQGGSYHVVAGADADPEELLSCRH